MRASGMPYLGGEIQRSLLCIGWWSRNTAVRPLAVTKETHALTVNHPISYKPGYPVALRAPWPSSI